MKHWQENLLDDLVSYLEPNEDVLGLLLFGSLSRPELQSDDWSDIDLLIVVEDGKIDRFFPGVEWITSFGRLYTYSQSADDFKWTTRACFENFNRVDFVMTTEGNLAQIDKWTNVPFLSGFKLIFSRTKVLDAIAGQTFIRSPAPPLTQEQFLVLVHNFRFKSMLAVYKVVRNDLLIALHLTLDLVRDCAVLAMLLRDRATGTTIHKQGGIGNQFAAQLEATRGPFTAVGILDSIQASNEVFERLARAWSDDYRDDHQLWLGWIEKARRELREK